MGKSPRINVRKKGHNFERETAEKLRKIFPDARRQLEYHIADCNGVDLMDTGYYRIQCKRTKKYVNPSVIEEIQITEPRIQVPILITKADHKPALAVIPLNELIRLLDITENFAYDLCSKTFVRRSGS